MRKVVGNLTAEQNRAAVASTRTEAVRIVAETVGIDAFELDREVRRAAIVRRIEPIRFPAGGGSDLEYLDVLP